MNQIFSSEQIEQRGFNYGVKHFHSTFSGPLTLVVQKHLSLSASKSAYLIGFGAVYLNDSRQNLTLDSFVSKGNYLRVHTTPRRFEAAAIDVKNLIFFENDEFIIVNKPSGLPVHPTVDNLHENLLSLLNRTFYLDLKITHRLDIPTRGLMVYAKTDKFQSTFNSLLQNGLVRKWYNAIVADDDCRGKMSIDDFPNGIWTHYMEPNPKSPKTISAEAHPQWLKCQMNVLSTARIANDKIKIHLELLTGRTHQIRAQMSYAGYPIVGDHLYGAKVIDGFESKIELECSQLEFLGQYSFKN